MLTYNRDISIKEGMNSIRVLVIGAGLAGAEAAHLLANHGFSVVLAECKRFNPNPAQRLSGFGELVCSNSLKSQDPNSAHGILKKEMEYFGSLILKAAHESAVPAGNSLAVDRVLFSNFITERLCNHPLIEVVEREITDPLAAAEEYNCSKVIVAAGPLASLNLSSWIKEFISADDFYFYDAIAPVVEAESLDFSKLYFKDRYKDERDYLNAPMNKQQYEQFITELAAAQTVPARDFEDYKFFESCLPIDVMAQRGMDTARFSCLKPLGLEPPGEEMPYAVVQLRRENLLGQAFNLVGFQTRLTHSEQLRVFRMIPGLENARFLHLGSIHRNSFLNAKALLNADFSSKKYPDLYFTGQLAGVEGYTESAAHGIYVALQILHQGRLQFPVETGLGALINYVLSSFRPSPSNINFGLFPPISLQKIPRKHRKGAKKRLIAQRAADVFAQMVREQEI